MGFAPQNENVGEEQGPHHEDGNNPDIGMNVQIRASKGIAEEGPEVSSTPVRYRFTEAVQPDRDGTIVMTTTLLSGVLPSNKFHTCIPMASTATPGPPYRLASTIWRSSFLRSAISSRRRAATSNLSSPAADRISLVRSTMRLPRSSSAIFEASSRLP